MRLATVALALVAVGSVAAAPIPNNGFTTGALGLNETLERRAAKEALDEGVHVAEDIGGKTGTSVIDNLSHELDTNLNYQKVDKSLSGKDTQDDALKDDASPPPTKAIDRLRAWEKKSPAAGVVKHISGLIIGGSAAAIGVDQWRRSEARSYKNKISTLENQLAQSNLERDQARAANANRGYAGYVLAPGLDRWGMLPGSAGGTDKLTVSKVQQPSAQTHH